MHLATMAVLHWDKVKTYDQVHGGTPEVFHFGPSESQNDHFVIVGDKALGAPRRKALDGKVPAGLTKGVAYVVLFRICKECRFCEPPCIHQLEMISLRFEGRLRPVLEVVVSL